MLKILNAENKKTSEMADLLRYQIKEIVSAKLKDENEEENLIAQRNKLKSVLFTFHKTLHLHLFLRTIGLS